MKLLQRYPKRIREAITHIENEMDYLKGTQDEYIGVLQNIILSQQALIHVILEHVYANDGIPTEPAGIWATNYEFDEWYRVSGDVFSDMKEGEIVILRDPTYIDCAGISSSMYKYDDRGIDVSINVSAPNHFRFQYKHDDKRIYVCMEDSPTSPNHFRQFDGTIDEHIQIIDNFLKSTGA